MTVTNTTPRVRQRSQNGDDGLEQHKGPVEGGAARASGSARRSAGQERAVGLAVTRREASCNTNCT